VNRPRPSTVRAVQVWAFTASLFAIACALWFTRLTSLPTLDTPTHLPWVGFAAAFVVGQFAAVRVEFHNEIHALNLSSAVLLPAIAFTSPKGVVLGAMIGYAVRALWVRQTVIKVAFNVTLGALVAIVTVVCFYATVGSSPVFSVRGWLSGSLVILVACVVSDGAVQVVIGLSAGHVALAGFRRVGLAFALALVADTILGFVALHMVADGLMTTFLFVVSAVLVAFGYAAYGRLQARHATLSQLYRFDQALAGLAENKDIILAVLGETLRLLNAGVAELIVPGPAGTECHRLCAGETEVTVEIGAHPFASLDRATVAPAVVVRGSSHGPVHDAVVASGFRDAAIVPVSSDVGAPRLLVVADRMGGDHVTFQAEDVALLNALAAHTAMALRSSRLLDELRKEVEVKEYQAHHDGLTGLANRLLFSTTVDRAVAQRLGNGVVGVLLMDLDGFKAVNDTMGHDVGDMLLQQLGARLSEAVGTDGLIARLGGDEFAVVVPRARGLEDVRDLANRLCLAVKEPVHVADTQLAMRASVGLSIAPDHGDDRTTLLRRADMAMYQAKRRGDGVAVYDDLWSGAPVGKPTLVSALRTAIDNSSLSMHYQPKADLRTGRVIGVEALLRWSHATYGIIGPDQIIPVAERSGLIRPLTLWVLDRALGQLAEWRRDGVRVDLAVNLSPHLLADPAISDDVNRLLDLHGVAPGELTLELTESLLDGRRADGGGVTERLAYSGVRLSMDDYGMGSSSLARLKDLPINELKIDKSFVRELVHSPRTAVIVASTIQLAHELGIKVVAEGIETPAAWHHLRHLHCDVAQGYLLSRPMPGEEFVGWFRERGPAFEESSNIVPLNVRAEQALGGQIL
jgi:diguanylate cyclase (GGDEF)-like protein